jgi:hypothetical protein
VTAALSTAPDGDVAIIVIGFVPAVAVDCAVSLSELTPAAGFRMVGGVKIAVKPGGKPVTVIVNDPENPPVTEVVTGISTLPPRTSEAAAEAVDTVNPLTTSVTTTVGAGDAPPPVPVTVMR